MAAVARAMGPQAVKKAPVVPVEGEHLLEWWMELHKARGSGIAGGNPLSFLEIEAWGRSTGRYPTPWEVRAIRAIDDSFMEASASPEG